MIIQNGKKVINGVGKQLIIQPTYEDEQSYVKIITGFSNWYYNEGQFENDMSIGFGRSIHLSGFNQIGWRKTGYYLSYLHGYGRSEYAQNVV